MATWIRKHWKTVLVLLTMAVVLVVAATVWILLVQGMAATTADSGGQQTGVVPGSFSEFFTRHPEVYLTAALFLCVSLLLGLLMLMTCVFSKLGLKQKDEALGLPAGSISAILALLLVLIFAIQAVYLYGDLSTVRYQTIEGVTQERLDSIPLDRLVSSTQQGDGRYDVLMTIEKSEASDDFAKQVLTTVSTLVVAVAGFYFGSKTAGRTGGVHPKNVET